MTREEIIELVWNRMQEHTNIGNATADMGRINESEISLSKAMECKQILNIVCTPAELRKLQEGGKL